MYVPKSASDEKSNGNGVSVADRQFKTYAMGWCAGIDVVGW